MASQPPIQECYRASCRCESTASNISSNEIAQLAVGEGGANQRKPDLGDEHVPGDLESSETGSSGWLIGKLTRKMERGVEIAVELVLSVPSPVRG